MTKELKRAELAAHAYDGLGAPMSDAVKRAMTSSPEGRQEAVVLDAKALTLGELQRAHVERQEEWCPEQKPDLSFRGNEMAGEVGEACNVIKKLERERHGWRGSRATKEQLAEELADVIHTATLCAITAGIDIEAATIAKFDATSEKNGLSSRIRALIPAKPAVEVVEALKVTAVEDIAAERRRQIDAEGWTPEHDDTHKLGELAAAAACYAASAKGHGFISLDRAPSRWPWSLDWWKPTNRRRDLVKAGALIVAEIERLDRLAALQAPATPDAQTEVEK